MKLDARALEQLMQTIAAGWNEDNARKAADCFHEESAFEFTGGFQEFHHVGKLSTMACTASF